MSKTSRRVLAASLLAAGVLAGCGDDDPTRANQIEGFSGSFALSSVENETLPFVVRPASFGGGISMNNARLTVLPGNRVREVREFFEAAANGTVFRTFSDSIETSYRVSGSQILIDRPFPLSNPLPDRLRVDTAVVQDGNLRMNVLFPFSNNQVDRRPSVFVFSPLGD